MNFGDKPMTVFDTAKMLGVSVDLVRKGIRHFADTGRLLGRASQTEGHWQRRLLPDDRMELAAYIIGISK